jgi:hypothetical protein
MKEGIGSRVIELPDQVVEPDIIGMAAMEPSDLGTSVAFRGQNSSESAF